MLQIIKEKLVGSIRKKDYEILNRTVREDQLAKLTFEQRPRGGERASLVNARATTEGRNGQT